MENVINQNFNNFFRSKKSKNSSKVFTTELMKSSFDGVRESFKKHIEPLRLSNKLNSEIVSDLIISKIVNELRGNNISSKKGVSDNQADFYVDESPYEVKVSMGKTWRGGEFSKRESEYIMIIRNRTLIDLRFFVVQAHLKMDDWKSSTHENYYATEIKLEDILKKPHTILCGAFKNNKVIFE